MKVVLNGGCPHLPGLFLRYNKKMYPQERKKSIILISLLFSVVLAIIAIVISRLVIGPSPWAPVYFFATESTRTLAESFGSAVLFTIIASTVFIILNSLTLLLFRKHRNVRIGLFFGYLAIVLIYLISFYMYSVMYQTPSIKSINEPFDFSSKSKCDNIEVLVEADGIRKNFCYNQVALAESDANVCDNIMNSYQSGIDAKQLCKDEVVKSKVSKNPGDVTACKTIENKLSRNSCYTTSAIKTGNYLVCNNTTGQYKELCYMRAVQWNDSQELRDKVCPLIVEMKDNVNNPCNKPL